MSSSSRRGEAPPRKVAHTPSLPAEAEEADTLDELAIMRGWRREGREGRKIQREACVLWMDAKRQKLRDQAAAHSQAN